MTSQPKLPAWANEPLVAIADGPMIGQWYTATDWHERRSAAQHMVQRDQPPAAALNYGDTGTTTPHPHVPDAAGAVWSSDPTHANHTLLVAPGTETTDQEHAQLPAEGVVPVTDIPTHDTEDTEDGWTW